MPYNPVQASRSVNVMSITVSLEVTPGPPWTAGQTITLRARVLSGGSPVPGRTVYFWLWPWEGKVIGTGTTGSDGYATLNYTIPWVEIGVTLPCSTISFGAQDATSWVKSNEVWGKCAYPTRISISAPDSVVAGQPFTVSGKLEYQSSSTSWSPLANRTVSIFYDSNKLADVTTDSGGNYSASVRINTPGTYTLSAVYAGEGFGLVTARARLTIIDHYGLLRLAPIIAGAGLVLLARRKK